MSNNNQHKVQYSSGFMGTVLGAGFLRVQPVQSHGSILRRAMVSPSFEQGALPFDLALGPENYVTDSDGT